jgi:threonine dehydrogenase-like Zn-dependent dehydrogenase
MRCITILPEACDPEILIMKTIRLHKISDCRFHDEPAPVPKTGEVLLHIRAVGICGSDLHWYQEGAIIILSVIRLSTR